MRKRNLFIFLLQLLTASAYAQFSFKEAGTITGYTTMKVSSHSTRISSFELREGQTDLNNLRLGVYATFKYSKNNALFLRPELSLIQHAIWMGARNAVPPPSDSDGFIQVGGPAKYHRMEFAPLVGGKILFMQLYIGPSLWYRFNNKTSAFSTNPIYAFLDEVDQAHRSWVGGYKAGIGISFWRMSININYGQNITRITDKTITYNGANYRFFSPAVQSLTYDINFAVFRNRRNDHD